MARLSRESVNLPSDVRTFVSRHWIKAALDESDVHLRPLARRFPRAEAYKHWYANMIVAPARYRAALWASLGEKDGDMAFELAMARAEVQRLQLKVTGQGIQDCGSESC